MPTYLRASAWLYLKLKKIKPKINPSNTEHFHFVLTQKSSTRAWNTLSFPLVSHKLGPLILVCICRCRTTLTLLQKLLLEQFDQEEISHWNLTMLKFFLASGKQLHFSRLTYTVSSLDSLVFFKGDDLRRNYKHNPNKQFSVITQEYFFPFLNTNW